jgi:hypothetical protein
MNRSIIRRTKMKNLHDEEGGHSLVIQMHYRKMGRK